MGKNVKSEKYLRDSIYVVETNIDDMSPVIYETVFEKLYEIGALEVFIVPVQMKKVRPGVLLTALIPKNKLEKTAEVILKETTSFGIRYYETKRLKLARKTKECNGSFGRLRINEGYAGQRLIKISPEYDDCRKIASRNSRPLKDML